MDNCEYCQIKSGVYDFKNVCCCARFILVLKKRETRAGWLNLWKKQKGEAFAKQVEDLVLTQWKK